MSWSTVGQIYILGTISVEPLRISRNLSASRTSSPINPSMNHSGEERWGESTYNLELMEISERWGMQWTSWDSQLPEGSSRFSFNSFSSFYSRCFIPTSPGDMDIGNSLIFMQIFPICGCDRDPIHGTVHQNVLLRLDSVEISVGDRRQGDLEDHRRASGSHLRLHVGIILTHHHLSTQIALEILNGFRNRPQLSLTLVRSDLATNGATCGEVYGNFGQFDPRDHAIQEDGHLHLHLHIEWDEMGTSTPPWKLHGTHVDHLWEDIWKEGKGVGGDRIDSERFDAFSFSHVSQVTFCFIFSFYGMILVCGYFHKMVIRTVHLLRGNSSSMDGWIPDFEHHVNGLTVLVISLSAIVTVRTLNYFRRLAHRRRRRNAGELSMRRWDGD